MNTKIAAAIATLITSVSSHAGLTNTELSLRTLAQATSSSPPITTSFERTVTVSDTLVEFPDVASLFNPGSPVPPGFARGLVNVAIDVGNTFITIDFANTAPFTLFASGFQNTYIFKFDSAAAVDIVGASVDPAVTTLGLAPTDITFSGNELFVNVESLPFNSTTFARINLSVNGGPLPIPEPSSYVLLGLGLGMLWAFRRKTARSI